MKHLIYYFFIAWLASNLLACSETTLPDNEEIQSGWLFTVADPELKGMTQTRALFPLGPEMENPIKSLALMIFDSEGQHLIEDYNYFAYRQIQNDTDAPNGKLVVYEPDYGQFKGQLDPNMNVTMCVMANVRLERLLNALRGASTTEAKKIINLDQFRQLMITLPYHQHPDSIGLVENIYMFGYYEGKLVPKTNNHYLKISLGRIISRINVTVTVSPALQKENLQYAFRLLNVEQKAYVFPGNQSPSSEYDDPYYHIRDLSSGSITFYHYVGPHSANTKVEATQMEIAYGRNLKDLDVTPDDDFSFPQEKYTGNTVNVAICNDPPTVNEQIRDFWLNRNTIYNISIHLKKKGESNTMSRSQFPNMQVIEIEP